MMRLKRVFLKPTRESTMKIYAAKAWRNLIGPLACAAVLASCGGGGSGGGSGGAPTPATANLPPLSISLLSGTISGPGNLNGTGDAARFDSPGSLALDPAGNAYVLDGGVTVRRVTPGGVVTLITGLTPLDGNSTFGSPRDGDRSVASFSFASAIAFDPLRGVLYVADEYRIRQVTLDGTVSTLGPLPVNPYSERPTAVAVAADGTIIMAAGKRYYGTGVCCLSTAIYRVAQSAEPVVVAGEPTVAGSADGQGTAARFNNVGAIAIDRTGNVYVMDDTTLRKVAPDGTVTTLAGAAQAGYVNGVGSQARFGRSAALAIDSDGNILVADPQNQAVRRVTAQGVVSTLYDQVPFGSRPGIAADGAARILYTTHNGLFRAEPGLPAKLVAGTLETSPVGVFVDQYGPLARDSQGNLFQADSYGKIRKFTPDGMTVLPFGPDGGDLVISPPGVNYFQNVLAIDAADNLYENYRTADVAGTITGGLIIKISPSGQRTLLASSTASSPVRFLPVGITPDATGNLYFIDGFGPAILKLSPSGGLTTVANLASLSDFRQGPPQNSELVIDRNGNVYITNPLSCVIYKINAARIPVLFAGQLDKCGQADGPAAQALLQNPRYPVLDSVGNLYIANNGTIRKISPDGTVTTLAGVAGRYGNTLGLLPGTLSNVRSLWIGVDDVLYAIASNALLGITTR